MGSNDFRANLRIYHGGHFVTKKYKTEYVNGALRMKCDMDEVCYFNLVDIVKNELNYGDLGEIWFKRHELSLFAGRKKLQSDHDIPLLMETKDVNGFVNVYVIVGGQEVLTKQSSKKITPKSKKKNEVGGPSRNSLNGRTSNPNLQDNLPIHTPWKPKLHVIRTKNSSYNPFTAAENRENEIVEEGEESRGDESDDELDSDVVLSEGDLDDEEDDDLFTQNVDEEISSSVHRGLKGLGGDSLAANDNEAQDDIEHEYLVDNDADLVSSEDELHSEHESDDEVINYPVFNPVTDFQRSIEFSLGLKFSSVYTFRKALRYHAVENGYDYYVLHNGSERTQWVKGRGKLGACTCGEKKNCTYKVHAKKCSKEETFQIRSLRLPHNCGWVDHNTKCTSLYLAERYLEYWRLQPETKVDTFQNKLLKELGIEVGYYKAYYAKEKALKMIYGEADEQYKRSWDYAVTVKKYNEGSSVFVQLGNVEKPLPVFKRMYMCLDACKKGFLAGCRPIIGVDGCHLKGPCSSQLLTGVSKDANCNIYPLAWAIVEVENRDSWTWFLDLLVKDIEAIENITFMSDRQKGLVEAFATVVPNAEIRYCCRHIWSNFELNWAGEAFKQIFWKVARAYTKEEFEQHMAELKKMSVGAHAYLNAIPTKHWCRHAFSTRCKSSMMLNNCCESFNNTLKKCRDKPVLSIMEWIRRYCTKRMFMKWERAEKIEGNLMPAALKQLNKAAKEARNCQLLRCGLWEFEVEISVEERVKVNLQDKTCDCGKWALTGIPCYHAFSCILKKRMDPETFVHDAYIKETYKKTYANHLKPLPGPKQWEKTNYLQPLPPPYKKLPGRPSLKKRRKEAGENEERQRVKKRGTKKTCSNCGQAGHNMKGCKNPGVSRPQQRKTKQRKTTTIPDPTQNTQQSSISDSHWFPTLKFVKKTS